MDDEGQIRSGCMLELRKWKKHAADDKLRDADADFLLHQMLLTPVADARSRQASLAVRPRDDLVEEIDQMHISVALEPPLPTPLDASSPSTTSVESRSDHSEDKDDPLAERLSELALTESALYHESLLVPKHPRLAFAYAPSSLNDDPAPLRTADKDSADVLRFRHWLTARLAILRSLEPLGHRDADRRRWVLIERMRAELESLSSTVSRAWEREKVEAGLYGFPDESLCDGPKVYRTDNLFDSRTVLQPFILVALVVTSALHTLSGVNRAATNLVLVMLRTVLVGAFISLNNSARSSASNIAVTAVCAGLSDAQTQILNAIPCDVRTAISRLNLQPNIIHYAACPSCCQTYPPDSASPGDPYPRECTFRETDKPVCGTGLVRRSYAADRDDGRKSQVAYAPLRSYPYRTVVSWIAGLFARTALESVIGSAWADSVTPPGGRWTDIMQAPAIQNLLGPNGEPYSQQPGSDVHLVFGLFIDWFNPGGNKQAGKSRSIGAIYLVCLNIPPHLRYRPENICLVGIIPGPNEPSLHQLNHFLRPLIDEMLTLWHSGVHLSRTSLYTSGRLIRAAIVPLICDLPALRKASGFAGHSSKHMCSFCLLKKGNINNLNRPWPSRMWKEHLDIATRWRDAETEKERNTLFEKHGIRWSELLRLPYWDPTRFAVVDAMHNLFLGELRHHCRDVLGIHVKDKVTNGAKKAAPHTPKEQQKWLDHVLSALRKKSLSSLGQPRKGYLVALAQLNNIVPSTKLTKDGYAKALLSWVERNSVDALRIPPILNKDTADFHLAANEYDISKRGVITSDVIELIRSDIKHTYLPSWIERPPLNFGSASHGKLKADHWRTVCTINLVVTLVRVWSSLQASESERLLLDNFMHLIIAVDLATRRSMDPERARLFDEHMLEYLRSLRRLFEHNLVPNHHLSLHIAACLLLFGPVHGWWGYPFERYNGIIQRFNTNNKIDEIPLTFMRLFYTGAELRWLMESTDWPDTDEFRDLLDTFNRAYQDATRGTRVLDVLSAIPGFSSTGASYRTMFDTLDEMRLDRPLYNRLVSLITNTNKAPGPGYTYFDSDLSDHRCRLSPHVRPLAKIEIDRVFYGMRDKNIRNSFIYFRNPSSDDPSLLRAGQMSRPVPRRT